MQLHRLRVENWRTIREAVELEVSDGVNVIHGPNEIGKSTLMDAICRGFFDRHHTGGTEMEQRQPWDSGLGPNVTIEFSVGSERYRLFKRFLADAYCGLWAMREGQWERIVEGKEADARIAELAAGEMSGRGLTNPQHWGLGQVLWAEQGQATQLVVGDSQQARLREALELTLDSTQGEAIEREIERRYHDIYTQTGRYRGGAQEPEVARLKRELEDVEARATELWEQRRAIDQKAHDLSEAEGAYEQTHRELKQVREELTQKRQERARLQKQQHEYDKLRTTYEQAQQRWQQLNDHVNRIKDADKAIADAREAVTATKKATKQAQRGYETAQEQFDASQQRKHEADEALKGAQRREIAAQRRHKWLDREQRLKDLTRRLNAARKLERQIEAVATQREKLGAPSPQQLGQLRKLSQQISDTQAELRAASLTVHIEPERKLSIEMAADADKPTKRDIHAGEDLRAVNSLSLHVKGVGRFTIRAGQSDAEELQEKLDKLQKKWRDRTVDLGSDVLHKLEGLSSQRQELEHRQQHLQEQLEEADDPEMLGEEVATVERERKTMLAEDPSLEETDEAVAEAQDAAERAQREREKTAEAQKAAVKDFESKREALDAARAEVASKQREEAEKAAALKTSEDQARRLREEDGLDDEQRRAKLRKALDAQDQAEQRLASAEKPPVEDLTADIEQLEQQETRLDAELGKQDRRIGSLSAELEQAGGQGIYSQYAEAVERREDLKRRHERAQLDADAVQVLRELVQEQKQEVFDAMLKPIRQRVTTMMQRVVGPRYDRIDFDEQLRPNGVRPAGREAEAGFDDLSYGTREQLMLSVRLALAQLLSEEGEPQCVILDDPLVNADRGRQRAALRVLEEAAGNIQILVFTCHPLSYEGLTSASWFDLEPES